MDACAPRLDPKISALEAAYDSESLDHEKFAALWPEAVKLIRAFTDSNWMAVDSLFTEVWPTLKTPQEQAFILQWAVAASEVEFDLVKRAKLLSRWSEIANWVGEPCRHADD